MVPTITSAARIDADRELIAVFIQEANLESILKPEYATVDVIAGLAKQVCQIKAWALTPIDKLRGHPQPMSLASNAKQVVAFYVRNPNLFFCSVLSTIKLCNEVIEEYNGRCLQQNRLRKWYMPNVAISKELNGEPTARKKAGRPAGQINHRPAKQSAIPAPVEHPIEVPAPEVLLEVSCIRNLDLVSSLLSFLKTQPGCDGSEIEFTAKGFRLVRKPGCPF